MKKILIILLALILAFLPLTDALLTVSAESASVRKVVSVVYDDSGSMKGDKWAYANYAMQAFCGMLNSEDMLYITYMSRSVRDEYTPQRVDLSPGGIQTSINSIKGHTADSTTPFRAVSKAYEKLSTVRDSDKNTQYWLVVITDGDFDECYGKSGSQKKQFLNDEIGKFTEKQMPNGTYPQVTFMAIGGEVYSPDEDSYKGIYTYSAKNADEITATMSKMADKISSRTRLSAGDMKQVDGKTIQVSSSIPLRNIAVLSQDSATKVSGAKGGKEDISVSREAILGYPGYNDLNGGAYLLGGDGRVIGAGKYDIAFDQEVDINDVVILFEPAIETKIFVKTADGEEKECSELENIPAGEKVSVFLKVYEQGTDKEIPDSDLPDGTKFKLIVSEEGQVAAESKGNDKSVSDYCLKNSETEFSASVMIENFNPIEKAVKVKPGKAVKYTLTPSYGGRTKNIRYENLSENKDMNICFTISADGKEITDPEIVKTFRPTITASPEGNSGMLSYSDDGKIVFTPNASSALDGKDSLEVKVTCTLENGVSATETYAVVVAEYTVVPVGNAEKIRKTEFFNNTKGTSFYVTKNDVKLKRPEVENRVSAVVDEEYEKLKLSLTVEDDGKVTVVPYSEEEHKVTFWNWWTNWWRYFRTSGKDMTVTLMHTYASGDSVIDVTGAPIFYQIFKVYLPLLIELLLLLAIIAYIVRYITKARFASNAVLYVGSIAKSRSKSGTHLLELYEVELNQYNKFKNLWNPFKELTVYVKGVSVTAAAGNMIVCNESFPWYCDFVKPKLKTVIIQSPKDIVNYCQEKDELMIQEIKPARVMDEQSRLISQDDTVYYAVRAEVEYEQKGYQRTEVIESAVVFCYSTKQN